ncbi:rhodanese-like domain-containing protein [Thetidibacter halocola]|uniref:Sulfurtransferase n=1 Tax=Thetidibacter halocola TaxID=2827239 RepID=A0A8J7W8Y5_9RHOB|nr:rhodanese-like domain-containing protein [Thetidibacter halocola]MBS0123097.1 sulfurtransferase [Thetidibacter halocola]
MTRFISWISAVFVFAVLGAGAPVLAQDIPKGKQTRAGLYLTAAEAAAFLEKQDALFVDVRTRSEVAFLGLPEQVDVHIPYMEMPLLPTYDDEAKGYALEINPDFPMVFRAYAEEHGVAPDTPIMLICRSGSRSARAADALAEMGFTQVYSIIDGFEGDKAKDGPHKGERAVNGWKNAGLRWTYAVRPDQAYPADRM